MSKYSLQPLNYEFGALEPYIDAQTMEIHYTRHHQAYLDKLNAVIDTNPELAEMNIEQLLKSIDSLPEQARAVVRNHGGGYYNHSFFWQIMTPGGKNLEDNSLIEAINKMCGDFETFQKHFSEKAMGVFGSGWVWVIKNSQGELEIVATANQDNPIMHSDAKIILGLDVWEHAYYLKYQNKRAEYIENWWNVVDWQKVAEIYNS
jgi:superoxide dismutase, Fe-Mn family